MPAAGGLAWRGGSAKSGKNIRWELTTGMLPAALRRKRRTNQYSGFYPLSGASVNRLPHSRTTMV